MSLSENLREMELVREEYWRKYPNTSPVKLHWRALTVRHCFHVLPGESILEVGAGTGLWTAQLARTTRGENSITAAVFNEKYVTDARLNPPPNTTFVHVEDLAKDLPAESFDYIVGTGILCHDRYPENLAALHRLLKPGGQLLFFEANFWNPQVFVKSKAPSIGVWAGNARCQVGMRKYQLLRMASHQGFTDVDIIPFDIIHPRTPRRLLHVTQSLGFILEHAPVVRELCGTLYIWARKPGGPKQRRPMVDLAEHEELFGAVSFVVPCHNEEMNIPSLVKTLREAYDPYIHEIVLVNDNSRDRTSEVAREFAAEDPRIKVVDREPPNGVGRALRDGYAAATGRYILTMDSDFVQIVPEFRDLFDAIMRGRDGAIGSRFSHDSIMVNYPFMKILANRGFHLLANVFLPIRVRDTSNNLKLMRAEILKDLNITEHHFAANAETGLRPILAGYDIEEVPISWINRTLEMGASSFELVRVGGAYARVLRILTQALWFNRKELRAQRREAVAARSASPADDPQG